MVSGLYSVPSRLEAPTVQGSFQQVDGIPSELQEEITTRTRLTHLAKYETRNVRFPPGIHIVNTEEDKEGTFPKTNLKVCIPFDVRTGMISMYIPTHQRSTQYIIRITNQ